MPGVLIVEALAQVGAVALLKKEENKGRLAFFAGIDNCRFKRQVTPGDTLRLEVEITRLRGQSEKEKQLQLSMAKLLRNGNYVCTWSGSRRNVLKRLNLHTVTTNSATMVDSCSVVGESEHARL